MTLEEFLDDFDKRLKDYEEVQENDESSESHKPNSGNELFFKYMCLYSMEGTTQNEALKKAASILMKDKIFLNWIQHAVEYIIASTLSATLAGQEEEDSE